MSAPADTAVRLLADVGALPGPWRRPVLVALMGLPGTGKSGTAAYLGSRLPLVVLSTDAIRLRYGLASGPATHEVMREVAAPALAAGAGVLLDGIHLGHGDRAGWRDLAVAAAAGFELVYTTAAPEVVAARLRARSAAPAETTAQGKFVVTPEHFSRFVAYLEEPAQDEPAWRLDTSAGPPAETAGALERYLRTLVG